MNTAAITKGTSGTGRGRARPCLDRGDRVVGVGTDETEAEPGTVATSFAGAHDEAKAARIRAFRVTGKPVEAAVQEILPFPDSGAPGLRVAVSEGAAVPLDPQTFSPAAARRLYAYTREVLAR
ncbi:hypothetical protein ACFWMH_14975 [Streptomyces tendae]|uniref:hypothetical protein n=1 Tax=Streptomyces tendae TaxID=1932 RepID=UPI003660F646